MKQYIEKDAVFAEIEKLISGLRRNCNPNPLGNMQECLAAAEIEALNLIKDSLDTLEVIDENAIKRDWYNQGYIKGRKEANIPANLLGLPRAMDILD